MRRLTPRQERFCQLFIELGNATEAHRQAGYGRNMSSKTRNEAACRMLKKDKIIARIAELQAGHSQRHEIFVQSITAQLGEDREFARDLKQPGVAVRASMGLARLHGLINGKPTVQVNVGGLGGLLAEIEERRALKDVTPETKS
ncbi:MAG: terminase small subunit [Rhodospirillales bacterium]